MRRVLAGACGDSCGQSAYAVQRPNDRRTCKC
nr:MAG TPA: hypothetical protein [Caudoviricetes sp.]